MPNSFAEEFVDYPTLMILSWCAIIVVPTLKASPILYGVLMLNKGTMSG